MKLHNFLINIGYGLLDLLQGVSIMAFAASGLSAAIWSLGWMAHAAGIPKVQTIHGYSTFSLGYLIFLIILVCIILFAVTRGTVRWFVRVWHQS